jgi:hypothetical protein
MLRALIMMTTSVFFLVFFFGVVAEPLQILFSSVEPLLGTGGDGTAGSAINGVGVLNQLRTYLFVLVPLIFGAGAIILAFVFAVRLRGTSGPGVKR